MLPDSTRCASKRLREDMTSVPIPIRCLPPHAELGLPEINKDEKDEEAAGFSSLAYPASPSSPSSSSSSSSSNSDSSGSSNSEVSSDAEELLEFGPAEIDVDEEDEEAAGFSSYAHAPPSSPSSSSSSSSNSDSSTSEDSSDAEEPVTVMPPTIPVSITVTTDQQFQVLESTLQAEARLIEHTLTQLSPLEWTESDAIKSLSTLPLLHRVHAHVTTLGSSWPAAKNECELRAVDVDNMLQEIMTVHKHPHTSATVVEVHDPGHYDAFVVAVHDLCAQPRIAVDETLFKLESLADIVAVIVQGDIGQLESALSRALAKQDLHGMLVLLIDGRVFFGSFADAGAALVLAYRKNYLDLVFVMQSHPLVIPSFVAVLNIVLLEPRAARQEAFDAYILEACQFHIPSHCLVDAVDGIGIVMASDRVDFDNRILEQPIEWGHVDVLRVLLADARVMPVNPDYNALVAACLRFVCSNAGEIITMLMNDRRIDPAADDNLALLEAIKHHNLAAVKILLLDARVNPNNPIASSPILCAAETGSQYCVKALLAHPRFDLTPDVNRALNAGCEELYDCEIVRLLSQDSRIKNFYDA